jgi:predicted dithiol-disulfide oxidoreductase (DUF899 family)
MTTHATGTRDQWLAARLELLKAEKELTHRSDEVAQRRQQLPWVRIDKKYKFDTDEGSASLADLFRGRSQLLVYHFMFGPDYTAGCPSCSAIADGFNGSVVHLANHDVVLMAVSRAPLAKLQAYKRRMGWTFPWARPTAATSTPTSTCSSPRTAEAQRRHRIQLRARGCDPRRGREPDVGRRTRRGDGGHDWNRRGDVHRERPGMSAFALEDGLSITRIPPTRAGSMACGACTSGSTAPPRGATNRTSGGAATTSTTSAERSPRRDDATGEAMISRRLAASERSTGLLATPSIAVSAVMRSGFVSARASLRGVRRCFGRYLASAKRFADKIPTAEISLRHMSERGGLRGLPWRTHI